MTEQKLPKMRSIPFILKTYGAELGIGSRYLRQLAKSGKIAVVRTGNKILINVDSLISYLNGGENGNG